MKILYFTQFYKPESIAAAFRAEENARAWVRDGHDVTVFTGYPNYPKGEIFPGYEAKLFTQEEMDGVRVLRSKLCATSSRTMIKRDFKSCKSFVTQVLFVLINSRHKHMTKTYNIQKHRHIIISVKIEVKALALNF